MVIEPRPYRLSIEQYHQMAEAGIFGEGERLELIDGVIIQMTPIGRRHASAVAELTQQVLLLRGRATIWPQNPIQLGSDGEPVPDLTLLRFRPDSYEAVDPTARDVLLVVEVADTTLKHDRQTKVPLYARHGIPEYWIIDVSAKPATLAVYRDPGQEGYQIAQIVRRGERLSPRAFPDLVLDTNALLR